MFNKHNVFEFSNINELILNYQEDIKNVDISSSRFPIRFIFLNSYEDMSKVVELFSLNYKKVELSSLLRNKNSWFTVDEIVKHIKQINETSVIVPLSEYIRFCSDLEFKEIISALAEIENNKIKLYIPLVGLWERFKKLFWDNYYRKDNWAPIWKVTNDYSQIKIYQIDFNLNKNVNVNDLIIIHNSEEWFNLWKKNPSNMIISLAKPLSFFFNNSLPDNTFSQELIKNSRDYLEKIYDFIFYSEYESKYDKYWDELLVAVSKHNKRNLTLKDIFYETLNLNNITSFKVDDFFKLCISNKNDEYKLWIIKSYFLELEQFKKSYFAHCLHSISNINFNNLIKKLFLEIFYMDYNESLLKERKTLINLINNDEISIDYDTFENAYNEIIDLTVNQKFDYLTNSTRFEKEKMLNIISNDNLDLYMTNLEKSFPELYYYLNWNDDYDDLPNWIIEYFQEYTKSKVQNIKSTNLNMILNDKNDLKNFFKWFYEIPKNQLKEENGTYILWIDALGAEWIPLLTYFLKLYCQKDKIITEKSIKCVNLPSATKFNKIICDKKIEKLDNYIHKNHYKYPNSLLDEMDIIKEMAIEISKIDSEKIVIVSDHGFSYLCVKNFTQSNKYHFENAEHEGRYMLVTNDNMESNEDYVITNSESINYENDKYAIPLKHISLNRQPSHEVHGGATPEELLVPYIILEKEDKSNLIDYEINIDSEINVSIKNELKIKISPKPSKHPLAFYNNDKLEIYEEDNEFVLCLNQNIKKGKQGILIKIGNFEKKVYINIKKGGMEEEKYDFGL